jgi:DNA primase
MNKIRKPEIISILQEKEGLSMRQREKHFWACCPLHQERTPSFCVDTEKQRFKCFGCGASGDVVDFIMKSHGLSFPDALRYLGINGDRPTRPDLRDIKRHEAVRKFRRWEQLCRRAISELLRLANRIDLAVEKPEDLELPGVSEMYLGKFIYEYHLSILNGKDAGLKFCLYKGLRYATN